MEQERVLAENDPLIDKKTWKLQTIKGLIGAFLWSLFAAASSVSVQCLERKFPDFELNAIRCGSPLLLCLFHHIYKRTLPLIEKEQILTASVYSTLVLCNTLPLYIAATVLPLSSVEALGQTSMILLGIIIFYLLLKETPSCVVISSALVSVVGVVLVIQPKFIFVDTGKIHDDQLGIYRKNETNVTANNFTNNFTQNSTTLKNVPFLLNILKYWLPVLFGLTAVLDTALVKKNPYIYEHIFKVLFWCFFSNMIASLILMGIFETPILPQNWYDALLVAIHSMSYLFIWPLYLYTVTKISGNTFNIMSSLSIVFMLLAQYTILSSILPGHRNWKEIVGVVLVILASTFQNIVELKLFSCGEKNKPKFED